MANNELSGPTVVTYLAKWIQNLKKKRYTYRIVFIPETIGSLTYLSLNLNNMKKNIIAGFNVTCVGDDRSYSYLPSRDGNTISDRVAKHVLKWIEPKFNNYTWLDRGSDERQYCAPGIDLPIASIMRTKYGQYPEYHTSLDNLETLVTPKGLDGGYWIIRKALNLIENNKKFRTTILGEPHMSKRGLYPSISLKKSDKKVSLMMDFISLCDGKTFLVDIADQLSIPAWDLYELVDNLIKNNIIIENTIE
jgi:aminopeptidase-like protein